MAALSRQQKLPALKTLLRKPLTPQSRGEAQSVLQQLSAQLGIPLRRTKLKRIKVTSGE